MEKILWLRKGLLSFLIVILLAGSVSSLSKTSSSSGVLVSLKQSNNLNISVDNHTTCQGFYCDIYNFSVKNLGGVKIGWDIPFYTKMDGVVFYEWENKSKGTYTIIIDDNGNYTVFNISSGLNESKENITTRLSLDYGYGWEPAKQFLNNLDSKYGRKVNSSASITIGNGETKYFWARFKNILGKVLKFDLDKLDPFTDSTTYKAGSGANGFDTDINTTDSEAATITAGSVRIPTTGGVGSYYIIDDFENNSVVQYDGGDGGNQRSCKITDAHPIDGTYSLNFSGLTTPGDDECIRGEQDYSRNGEGFNASFTFQITNIANWMSIGLTDTNATMGTYVDDLGIVGGNGIGCPADAICIYDDAVIDTGLDCNNGNECSIILEFNTSLSGVSSNNESLFWVWVNGTKSSSNYTKAKHLTELDFFVARTNNPPFDAGYDNLNITNGSTSQTNDTTLGFVRSNKFVTTNPIRRYGYNSSETGAGDGLLFNFSCNDYTGTWSQGGGTNFSRPPENTLISCPVVGTVFSYETNVSEQQDLEELNISLVLNSLPVMNTIRLDGSPYRVGSGITPVVNATDGDSDTVTYFYKWYLNNVENTSLGGNSSYSTQSLNTTLPVFIGVGNLTKYDNLTLEVLAFDSYENGTHLNISVIIENTRPRILLVNITNITALQGGSVLVNVSVADNDSLSDLDILFINFTGSHVVNTTFTNGIGTFRWNFPYDISVGDYEMNLSVSDSNDTQKLFINSTPFTILEGGVVERDQNVSLQKTYTVSIGKNTTHNINYTRTIAVSNINQNNTLININSPLPRYTIVSSIDVENQSGTDFDTSFNTTLLLVNFTDNITQGLTRLYNISYQVEALNTTGVGSVRTGLTRGDCTVRINVTNNHNRVLDDLTIRVGDEDLPHFSQRQNVDVFWDLVSGSGGGAYEQVLVQNVTISVNVTNYGYNGTEGGSGGGGCGGELCGGGAEDPTEFFTNQTVTIPNSTTSNSTGLTENDTTLTSNEVSFSLGSVSITQDLGASSTYEMRIVYGYSSPPNEGGGGGGGAEVAPFKILKIGNMSLQINNEKGGGNYLMLLRKGGVRTRNVVVLNDGGVNATIFLSCEEVTKGVCEFVTINTNELLTKPGSEEYIAPFTVSIPEDIGIGNLFFNILARGVGSGGESAEDRLEVQVDVSSSGVIFEFFDKLREVKTVHSPVSGGKDLNIPVWVISLFSLLAITGVLGSVLMYLKINPALSIGGSFLTTLLFVIVMIIII